MFGQNKRPPIVICYAWWFIFICCYFESEKRLHDELFCSGMDSETSVTAVIMTKKQMLLDEKMTSMVYLFLFYIMKKTLIFLELV